MLNMTNTSSKLIALCMLTILVLGQMAVSVHSAIHAAHFTIQAAHETNKHDAHDNHTDQDKQNLTHQCPECLLTKAFNLAILTDSPPISALHFSKSVFNKAVYRSNDSRTDAYQARGPPSLLI